MTAATESKMYWLIECDSPARYLLAEHYGAVDWTTDPHKAQRFTSEEWARKLIAQTVLKVFDDLRVEQHIFLSEPEPETQPAIAGNVNGDDFIVCMFVPHSDGEPHTWPAGFTQIGEGKMTADASESDLREIENAIGDLEREVHCNYSTPRITSARAALLAAIEKYGKQQNEAGYREAKREQQTSSTVDNYGF